MQGLIMGLEFSIGLVTGASLFLFGLFFGKNNYKQCEKCGKRIEEKVENVYQKIVDEIKINIK